MLFISLLICFVVVFCLFACLFFNICIGFIAQFLNHLFLKLNYTANAVILSLLVKGCSFFIEATVQDLRTYLCLSLILACFNIVCIQVITAKHGYMNATHDKGLRSLGNCCISRGWGRQLYNFQTVAGNQWEGNRQGKKNWKINLSLCLQAQN